MQFSATYKNLFYIPSPRLLPLKILKENLANYVYNFSVDLARVYNTHNLTLV